ncbi:hypothetical protein EV401DRAFT_2193690 [Pisolithus croceorrhizus]|nr:hypothetical protein EV401DRAFT_2193690 [Pisolithus croceorrhizus]
MTRRMDRPMHCITSQPHRGAPLVAPRANASHRGRPVATHQGTMDTPMIMIHPKDWPGGISNVATIFLFIRLRALSSLEATGYDEHSRYVMNRAFSPKDTNAFASICLDRIVKMGPLGSPKPAFIRKAPCCIP